MSPTTHPSDAALLQFAAGTLAPGPRVVLAAHLAVCPRCREMVRAFETVGGVLLQDALPAPDGALALAPGALSAVMARITVQDAAPVPPRARVPHGAPVAPAGLPEGFMLPAALAGCGLGPLRPLAPGVRVGRVTVPGEAGSDVLLLRIGPGRRIPEHAHSGPEYTQVLFGSYHDRMGRYGPGDLVEADDALAHAPMVDDDGECICLVAIEGPLRFRGMLGLVLRPFLPAPARR